MEVHDTGVADWPRVADSRSRASPPEAKGGMKVSSPGSGPHPELLPKSRRVGISPVVVERGLL